MDALGGPTSTTWGQIFARNRASLVPPVVESSGSCPVSSRIALVTAEGAHLRQVGNAHTDLFVQRPAGSRVQVLILLGFENGAGQRPLARCGRFGALHQQDPQPLLLDADKGHIGRNQGMEHAGRLHSFFLQISKLSYIHCATKKVEAMNYNTLTRPGHGLV